MAHAGGLNTHQYLARPGRAHLEPVGDLHPVTRVDDASHSLAPLVGDLAVGPGGMALA